MSCGGLSDTVSWLVLQRARWDKGFGELGLGRVWTLLLLGCSTGPAAGGAYSDARPAVDAVAGVDGEMSDGTSDGAPGTGMPDASADGAPDVADGGSEGTPEGSFVRDAETESARGCIDGGPTQCGAPTACGPVVQTTEVVGTSPTPSGGTLAPGLYFLTRASIYRGQSGGPTPTLQVAEIYASGEFAESSYDDGVEQSPISGTYSTSGTTISTSITCPTAVSQVDVYTATPTTFTRYRVLPVGDGGSSEVYELVETKQ